MTDHIVKELNDSGAAITGGTAGIGKACARALLEAGVQRVVLIGRSRERGQRALDELSQIAPAAAVHFISADCGSLEDAERAVGEAEELLGGIDVLVNSISTAFIPELLVRIRPEDVQPMLVKQLVPVMLMTRLVLPLMSERRGGVIVNVSSDASKTATPGETVVGATMAAIKMFSQAAALEAKRFGVRVNTITPSLVADTEGTERITAGETFSSKLFAAAARKADLGVATAADQGALVVFLASPAAARLTGQAISVNGGISAA